MLIKAPGTRKKKQREVPTLRLVCFHSLPQGFLYFFSRRKATCQSWMVGGGGRGKKEKSRWGREKNTEFRGEKKQKTTTLTGVTHLVARVFVWCSLRRRAAGGGGAPPWGSGGSQVESSERGGEFPPRSLTVLTAAHWLDVASPLKRDTRLVVEDRCVRPQGGRCR